MYYVASLCQKGFYLSKEFIEKTLDWEEYKEKPKVIKLIPKTKEQIESERCFYNSLKYKGD